MFPSSLLSVVSAILIQRNLSSTYQAHLPYASDPESLELSNNPEVDRKKSLAHLDRENIFPGHCQWAYLAVNVHESGLALSLVPISQHPLPDRKRDCWKGPGPGGPWMVYCYIWVPIFSCINVVGFDAIVICHLTLTRFRSSQSSATTCIAREDGPSQSYPHPHGRRQFLDFQLY